ncbi:hypothetical protein B0H13DRAFT_1852272 [Mycena leptocephala]|nr:hypothetical protein B0H13DRAFT_1852272 [Mycena leptocephala]
MQKLMIIDLTLNGSWSTNRGLAVTILCPAIVVFFMVAGIVNAYRILAWLCRHVVGPPWDQSARIEADLGGVHRSPLRIQTVSFAGAGQFTLVTVFPSSSLVIHPLSPHSSAQSAALLQAIDLGDAPTSLTVSANCAFDFPALLEFIQRHQLLEELTLEAGAIHPTSLVGELEPPARPGRITTFTSAAMYIPHMLRTEYHIARMTITSASDSSALARALDSVASSSAGARVRNLNLNFTRTTMTM